MCEEQLAGQMSIFDFLEPVGSTLDNLPESEMVKAISDATGINFKYRDSFWGWQAKIKGVTFSVQYDNYRLEDNKRRFIGADWNTTIQGAASPCDSIQEAIEFFKAAKKRAEGG